MSLSRFVIAGLLVSALAAVTGCSSSTEKGAKSEPDVGTTESDLKLNGSKYLGKIKNGETRSGWYYAPPTYRSYGFDAKGGDVITVDVKSEYGDPMGWITDSSYNVLAFNDDASAATLNAQVKYTVPDGQTARSYRIVLRDYDLLEADFSVKLSIKSAPATCSYDGQTYQPGDSFASSDGCNTCSCGPTGAVGCTKKACICNPATETHRTYIGTPDQCMVIRYTCQPGQVPFTNACGCGCETVQ